MELCSLSLSKDAVIVSEIPRLFCIPRKLGTSSQDRRTGYRRRVIGNTPHLRFRRWQLDEKCRPFAQLAGYPNLAAVDVHNRFGDGKSQPAALGRCEAWVGGFHPEKTLENVG